MVFSCCLLIELRLIIFFNRMVIIFLLTWCQRYHFLFICLYRSLDHVLVLTVGRFKAACSCSFHNKRGWNEEHKSLTISKLKNEMKHLLQDYGQ